MGSSESHCPITYFWYAWYTDGYEPAVTSKPCLRPLRIWSKNCHGSTKTTNSSCCSLSKASSGARASTSVKPVSSPGEPHR